MHEKLMIVNLLYLVLFAGLTQECLDLSFWFKHETTPFNTEQIHGITVLSEHQLFNTETSRLVMLLCPWPIMHDYVRAQCHGTWFNLTLMLDTSILLCLLLNYWVTKSRVLFIVHEGNLRSGLSAESARSGYSCDYEIQCKCHWLQPECLF